MEIFMKKRLFAIFIAAMIIISLIVVPAYADSLSVGSKISGFTLYKADKCMLFGADTYLFRHDKTGAKLLYIANDDVNRMFDITFQTPGEDTGISHVFEHATLNGSEKYPANVFFNVSYETINTYINAATYMKYTSFPLSSILDEQLLKLADYYLDAVFHPLLLTNENIFNQEAWRYEMKNPDDALKLNGTVYSEMKGALTPPSRAYYNALKTLYPGSNTSAIFGGDPDIIPTLTYEDAVNYHEKYYRPSNSLVILYGKVELEKYLELIDGYFSEYTDEKPVIEDKGYTPISGNIEKTFPMQAVQNTGDIAYYMIPCDIKDNQDIFDINLCSMFLDTYSSELMQNLKDGLPHVGVSVWVELTQGVNPTLIISASNLRSGEAAVFKQIIQDSMKSMSENGINKEITDSFLAAVERDFLMIPESSGNKGLSVLENVLALWSINGDEQGYFKYLDYIKNLDPEKLNERCTNLIKKYFADPKTSVLTLNIADTSLSDKDEAKLTEKLADTKASMSKEQIDKIVESSNLSPDTSKNEEVTKKINVSTVDVLKSDLESYKPKEYPYSDTTEDSVRYLSAEVPTDGIGICSLYFDVSGLSDEQLLYLNLFDSLSVEFGSDKHTQAELYNRVIRYFNGSSSFLATDDDTLYVVYNTSVLDNDLKDMYDVLYEWIYEIQFDDTDYLKSLIDAYVDSWEASVLSEGTIISRAKAQKDRKTAYSEYIGGLNYYEFLKKLKKKLNENPTEVTDNLKLVQNALKNRNNAKSVYAGSKNARELNKKYAKEFFSKLNNEVQIKPQRNLKVSEGNEAIVSNTDVNYNLIYAPFSELNTNRDGSLNVILNMMNDKFFMPYLRNEKGAYGVRMGIDNSGIYICSYRDPQIASTFEFYDKLSSLVENSNFTQQDIDGYIMSTFSKRASNKCGILTDTFNMLSKKIYFNDKEDYDTLNEILNTTPDKVKKSAQMFKLLAENGIRGSVGKKSNIILNKSFYDIITEPFKEKETELYYCGKRIPTDVSPYIENDILLVPLRAIFEAMGCNVGWDENEQKITIEKSGITVILHINSNEMNKNGETVIIDTPARIINERTMVPVSAVSKAVSCSAEWVEDENYVIITEQ